MDTDKRYIAATWLDKAKNFYHPIALKKVKKIINIRDWENKENPSQKKNVQYQLIKHIALNWYDKTASS